MKQKKKRNRNKNKNNTDEEKKRSEREIILSPRHSKAFYFVRLWFFFCFNFVLKSAVVYGVEAQSNTIYECECTLSLW